MQTKFLFIVSMALLAFLPVEKLVYIEKDHQGELSLEYDTTRQKVNLFIDESVITDEKVREGIKFYIGSFFITKNNQKLECQFNRLYKMSFEQFASQYKKQICTVIYYLELPEHGDLVHIYNREAYILLDIKELKPEIDKTKKKLYKSTMPLIDIIITDTTKTRHIELD